MPAALVPLHTEFYQQLYAANRARKPVYERALGERHIRSVERLAGEPALDDACAALVLDAGNALPAHSTAVALLDWCLLVLDWPHAHNRNAVSRYMRRRATVEQARQAQPWTTSAAFSVHQTA